MFPRTLLYSGGSEKVFARPAPHSIVERARLVVYHLPTRSTHSDNWQVPRGLPPMSVLSEHVAKLLTQLYADIRFRSHLKLKTIDQ